MSSWVSKWASSDCSWTTWRVVCSSRWLRSRNNLNCRASCWFWRCGSGTFFVIWKELWTWIVIKSDSKLNSIIIDQHTVRRNRALASSCFSAGIYWSFIDGLRTKYFDAMRRQHSTDKVERLTHRNSISRDKLDAIMISIKLINTILNNVGEWSTPTLLVFFPYFYHSIEGGKSIA